MTMNKLKYGILLLTAILIVVLMTATIVESSKGTPFVAEHIYGATWFVLLWAAIAALSAVYMGLSKLHRRPWLLLLHGSLMVILLGALLSWLTSDSGTIHLRQGQSTSTLVKTDGLVRDMGFRLTLKDFHVDYYPGTDAPVDYVSRLTADNETVDISMNHIGQYAGYRFTQSGYDSDMKGTTLGVYYDPWGIAVTYLGYVLLLVSLMGTLFSKRTRMRSYYHRALQKGGSKLTVAVLLALTCMTATPTRAQEQVKIDKGVARNFGNICVLYNSRICPINTVATDFVTKLCGRPSWKGLSANEVLAGWVFDVPYWETVKMIEVKDKHAQTLLGLSDKWASFSDFWNQYNEYKLEKPLKQAALSGDKKLQKQLRDADEKFNIVRMLYGGEMLKMFPYKNRQGKLSWIAPGQPMTDGTLPEKELYFVKKSMDFLAEAVITGNTPRAEELVEKIAGYQQIRAKGVIPCRAAIYTETTYNAVNAQRWTVMVYLSLSLVLVIVSTLRLAERWQRRCRQLTRGLIAVMVIHTTLLLGLRWMVSGHLPMSNGYETMQFMAWATLLLTLWLQRRFEVLAKFGPLLAAFALLVAMITDSNPQVTQLMPVLQSPLLSVHVMVIMFAYALFGLMALTAIQGLVAHRQGHQATEDQLAALSRFLLYPAVALLAIGIFIGAVWANVSWGRYWSWDSKETWALITLLIYAAPLHNDLQWMRPSWHLHLYLLLAFLSVLMTYFGANYFLAGFHSYA